MNLYFSCELTVASALLQSKVLRGRTRRGHTGPVVCLAVDSVRQLLYSGGVDGHLLRWPLATIEGEPMEPELLRAGVCDVHGDGPVATRTGAIVQVRDIKCLALMPAVAPPPDPGVWPPEPRPLSGLLLSGSVDQSVRVWCAHSSTGSLVPAA